MGEVVGPSEEGEMLEGPLGHLVHPLPPSPSTSPPSCAPPGLVPRGEAVVFFIIVIVTIKCKALNIVSGTPKVLRGHCDYNEISGL